MGMCWSSRSNNSSVGRDTLSSLTTTANFSSSGLTSQTTTTSNATASSANTSLFSTVSGSGSEDAHPYPPGQILPNPNLRIFSFSELKAATRSFRADTVLGEGGFGKVYKGWLESSSSGQSGSVIAVKKLNSESAQGFEEWRSEVNFLGQLSHPNLVKLIGYCWEDRELLLVYEFMQKGSLENHLFGRGSAVQPLAWETRIKISTDAARGLAFLHESEKSLIYRDFKASNILLDGSYNAKISDFGLAKLGPSESKSHVTTRVIGTYGYAAPEYVATGHLYVKSDVYGFGVVLVELLTGLRALDNNRPVGQVTLTDWIKPHLSDRRKLKQMMDSRLEGKYPSKAAFQLSNLALTCLEIEPKNRPGMKQVLDTLQTIASSSPSDAAAASRKPRRRPNSYAAGSANNNRGNANAAPRSALHQRVHHHQQQNGGGSYPSYPLPQRVP